MLLHLDWYRKQTCIANVFQDLCRPYGGMQPIEILVAIAVPESFSLDMSASEDLVVHGRPRSCFPTMEVGDKLHRGVYLYKVLVIYRFNFYD